MDSRETTASAAVSRFFDSRGGRCFTTMFRRESPSGLSSVRFAGGGFHPGQTVPSDFTWILVPKIASEQLEREPTTIANFVEQTAVKCEINNSFTRHDSVLSLIHI